MLKTLPRNLDLRSNFLESGLDQEFSAPLHISKVGLISMKIFSVFNYTSYYLKTSI